MNDDEPPDHDEIGAFLDLFEDPVVLVRLVRGSGQQGVQCWFRNVDALHEAVGILETAKIDLYTESLSEHSPRKH